MVVFKESDGWRKWPDGTALPVLASSVEVMNAEDGTRWVRANDKVNAEFALWKKETLVQFAEEATVKLKLQGDEIRSLEDQVKTLHLAWKNALREHAVNTTVTQ